MRKKIKVKPPAAMRPATTEKSEAPKPASTKPEEYGKGGVFRSVGGGKRVRV